MQALAEIPREVETAIKLLQSGCVPPLLDVVRAARIRRMLPSPETATAPLLLAAIGSGIALSCEGEGDAIEKCGLFSFFIRGLVTHAIYFTLNNYMYLFKYLS